MSCLYEIYCGASSKGKRLCRILAQKVACEFESYISVISSQFHAKPQNEQKHGEAFSEQEFKNETK